jgi:hypothetical protein
MFMDKVELRVLQVGLIPCGKSCQLRVRVLDIDGFGGRRQHAIA